MADLNPAPSENVFDQAQPAANRFAKFDPETRGNRFSQFEPNPDDPITSAGKPPEESSTLGALKRGLMRSAAPALGSLPGMMAGAELGGAGGAVVGGPIGAAVGGVTGALAGGFLGATAIEKAQHWGLSKLPDKWVEAIGMDDRQEKIDQGEHPVASFMGGLIPYAVTMRPGSIAKGVLPDNPTTLQRIMANPVTARVFGGSVMGGIELGQEAATQENLDWRKVAIATGFGLVFNKPTRLGERITELGARPMRESGLVTGLNARARERWPSMRPPWQTPTIAEAADSKVAGPGITESVYMGGHEQAPEAALSAQDTARTEQTMLYGQPERDVHATARQMEPEAFKRYDDLVARREEFRNWIADYNEPRPEALQEARERKADLERQLQSHLEERGGYAAGPEARRLRAQIRDAQREYDTMAERGRAYAEGTAEETADLAAARKHLMATDAELRDMHAEIQAAYRRAADAAGTQVLEPPAAPAPTPAEAVAAAPQAPQAAAPAAGEQPIPASPQAEPGSTAAPEVIAKPSVPSNPAVEADKAFIAVDVEKKLLAAGRPPGEALAAGQLVAARYEARAATFGGQIGTPRELYEREAAEIRGVKPPRAVKPKAPPEAAPAAEAPKPKAEVVPGPPPVRGPRARPEESWSLLEFLASRGGIDPGERNISDVRTLLGTNNKMIPGFGHLIRKGGMRLDAAREAATEAGYLHGEMTGGESTRVNDLLDAIDREARGKKQYREDIGQRPEHEQDVDQRRHEMESAVHGVAEEAGYKTSDVPQKVIDRTVEIMEREGVSDPSIAFERAWMEQDENAVEIGELKSRSEAIPEWDVSDESRAAQGAGEGIAGASQQEVGGVREGAREPSEFNPEAGRGRRLAQEQDVDEFFQRVRPGEGGQQNLPGTEPITDAELAQRRANAPLKPTAEQRPMEEGLFGTGKDQKELFQRDMAAPFYSAVEHAINISKQAKASPEQWLGMIKNAVGVKPEEMKWLGLEDWLKAQDGPVTKEQVADYVRANNIRIQEVEKGGGGDAMRAIVDFQEKAIEKYGGLTEFWERAPAAEQAEWERLTAAANAEKQPGATKFEKWQLPGGENYRELLLTLPSRTEMVPSSFVVEADGRGGFQVRNTFNDAIPYFGKTQAEAQEIVGRLNVGSMNARGENNNFLGSHWDEPNVLAHIRMNDRTIDGKRALLVEEIQSDWHQKGRRLGYKQPDEESWVAYYESKNGHGQIDIGRGATKEEALKDSGNWMEMVRVEYRKEMVPHGTAEIKTLERDARRARLKRTLATEQSWRKFTDNKADNMREAGDYGFNIDTVRAVEKYQTTDPDYLRISKDAQDAENAYRAASAKMGQGVPNAPFKTSWPELTLKRVLRYAAEHGYEKIAWTPGEVQADRYNLAKHVKKISYIGDDYLSAWDHNGEKVITKAGVKPEDLPDLIGKEAAQKLLDQKPIEVPTIPKVAHDDLTVSQTEHQYIVKTKDGRELPIGKGTVGSNDDAIDYAIRYFNNSAKEINQKRELAMGRIGPTRTLEGLELKVGGEGMKGFYDDMLPKAANKLVKKFGAKVERGEFGGEQKDIVGVRAASRDFSSGSAFEVYDLKTGELDNAYLTKAAAEDAAGEINKAHSEKHVAHVIDITPELREAATSQGFPLFQAARGKINLMEGRKPIITLMKDANASTFIHETGHEWLEQILRDAEHPLAPDQLRDDATTITDWLGVHSPDDIKTRHHEKFARGFEQYLREGVAPSEELAGVFAKFRDWLLKIYETIKGLGKPINDDIRQVFDRMLVAEPQRTVVAREREPGGPTLPDIHAKEAEYTEPHEAEATADRVKAERERYVNEPPPEIAHEIAPIIAEVEQAEAAKRGGGAGADTGGEPSGGTGGLREVVERGGKPEPVTGRGGMGAGSREERASGGEAARESGGVSGAGEPERARANAGNALAPSPADSFGPAESPFIDRAGNIRVENLTTSEDVSRAIHEAADANQDFIGERQGVVTDGQVMDLANDLGLPGAEALVRDHVVGRAYNAVQVIALRKLLIDSATRVSAAMKKAAIGTDEDVMAYAMAKDRHQLIQGTVAGATAEAGRALRAFRDISMGEGAENVDQFVRGATGRTLFQLKMEAKIGAMLDSPMQVSKMMQDANRHSYGRMMMEYFINNLISGISTHVTYTVGNGVLTAEKMLMITPAAAAIGQVRRAMGREGEVVHMGEVGAGLRGLRRGVAPALRGVGQSFRTGLTSRLPNENLQASMPFSPGAEVGLADVVNMNTTYADVVGGLYSSLRGVRDTFTATAALAKAGGAEGAPTWQVNYSPLGAIPDISVRGVNALPLGTLARAPGRMVAAIHTFFRVLNYSVDIEQQAFRTAMNEGLKGTDFDARVAQLRQSPTPEMMDQSAKIATDLTLMGQSGPFMRKVSSLFNWERELPGLGMTQPLKFIDPFVHIAGQVVKQSVGTQTPLAMLSPEVMADLRGKNGNIAQDMAMAKMLVGSLLGATFAGLAAEGMMTGSGPSDHNKAAMWRLAGNQPHSVRIGDMWYATHKLGPLGLLAGVSADMYEVAHLAAEGEMAQVAAHFMHAFTQNFLDEGFARGPADLLKAIEQSDRYGEAYVRNFLSSFVPYSVGMQQMAKAVDPYSRQTRTMMDAIVAKVPGLSESLNPRIDVWGEPLVNFEAAGGRALTAIYMTRMSKDPVNIAMVNLGIGPAPVEKKIRNVELTPDQYEAFARIAGRMAKQRLDVIVRSPDFQTWPAATRHDVMLQVIKESREAGRNLMFMKYPQILRDATEAKLKKLHEAPKAIQ